LNADRAPKLKAGAMLLLSFILALTPVAQSSSVRSIRDIDFKNFSYPKLPTGKCSMTRVRVRNGKYGSVANFSPRATPRGGCGAVDVGVIPFPSA
jgi:hypothetical protein